MGTVYTETVTIDWDGPVAKSYLARPMEMENPLPGVLVIPEFWGLTEYIQERTRQLAGQGYCALAVDIYGEGQVAQDATEAMNKLFANLNKHTQSLVAHQEELKKLEWTDETKTAAIGYCLGGALALHLVRMGLELKGVVSFHGDLTPHTSIQANQVKAKILVCHGEGDSLISSEQVDNFKKEMDGANVDYKFVAYPGALHGFTNPQATENGKKFGLPIAYNKQADQLSWDEMERFFSQIFS